MTEPLGEAYVELTARMRPLQQNMAQARRVVERQTGQMMAIAKKAAIAFGAYFGVRAIGRLGKSFIEAASDAQEADNLFKEVFGSMSKRVGQWSDATAKALGMNAVEIRKNVGTFRLMIEGMGIGANAATGMAKSLTKLGYDMASFRNLQPDEMFEKLRAALSGEAEPMKRLGIIINETTVKQYALATGMIKGKQKMSEAQKVAARYGLILKNTAKDQGDLVRTSGSYANQLRRLSAEWMTLKQRGGEALLPISVRAIRLGLRALQQIPKAYRAAVTQAVTFYDFIHKALDVFSRSRLWQKLTEWWNKFLLPAALDAWNSIRIGSRAAIDKISAYLQQKFAWHIRWLRVTLQMTATWARQWWQRFLTAGVPEWRDFKKLVIAEMDDILRVVSQRARQHFGWLQPLIDAAKDVPKLIPELQGPPAPPGWGAAAPAAQVIANKPGWIARQSRGLKGALSNRQIQDLLDITSGGPMGIPFTLGKLGYRHAFPGMQKFYTEFRNTLEEVAWPDMPKPKFGTPPAGKKNIWISEPIDRTKLPNYKEQAKQTDLLRKIEENTKDAAIPH